MHRENQWALTSMRDQRRLYAQAEDKVKADRLGLWQDNSLHRRGSSGG